MVETPVKARQKLDDKQRELIRQNMHLVKMIASKMAIFLPRHIDFDDLVHDGLIGLMDAAMKYDCKLGMRFSSYASIRIKGSILDSLRSLDWIPRRIRRMSKKIEKTREILQQELKREPSLEEISRYMGVPPLKLRQIMNDVEHSRVLSFEDLQSFSNKCYMPEKNVFSVGHYHARTGFERVEIKEQLKWALKDLTERERLVLALYYLEDLTLKEIKLVLNISEARISQIHTCALRKMREKIYGNNSGKCRIKKGVKY